MSKDKKKSTCKLFNFLFIVPNCFKNHYTVFEIDGTIIFCLNRTILKPTQRKVRIFIFNNISNSISIFHCHPKYELLTIMSIRRIFD